jgi:hypothetical protein
MSHSDEGLPRPDSGAPRLAFTVELNWLRECTPGFPIGVRAVRAWSREELERALAGASGIEWLRALVAESCSVRWRETAEAAGGKPSQLDDLALHLRGLNVSEEDALWRAAEAGERLGALRTWARERMREAATLEAEIARRGEAFWRSVEGEWLREAAPSVEEREAAVQRLGALLTRGDLTAMLVRLRELAESEWAEQAGWFRRRLAECGPAAANGWLARLSERIWERAGLAIVRRADGRSQERAALVRVALPVMDKRAWETARESFDEAEMVESAEGHLEVRRARVEDARGASAARRDAPWDGFRAAAERGLGTAMGRRSEAPRDDGSRLGVERGIPAEGMKTPWARLLAAYGLDLPRRGERAALALSVPLDWCEEWALTPGQREARYFERLSELSLALQELGRHWLPAIALSERAKLEDAANAQALLVYAASEGSADGRTASYGYDAKSPRDVQRCALTAARRLPELLEALRAELLESGEARLAEQYAPERARAMITQVARQHRALARLLAVDAFQLEECFHLVDAAREAAMWERRNPARAMRKLMQSAGALAHARQRADRRLGCAAELGAVYLVAGTRVLAEGKRPGRFAVRLIVEAQRQCERMAA